MKYKSITSGKFYRFTVKRIGVIFAHVNKVTANELEVTSTRGINITVRKKDIINFM